MGYIMHSKEQGSRLTASAIGWHRIMRPPFFLAVQFFEIDFKIEGAGASNKRVRIHIHGIGYGYTIQLSLFMPRVPALFIDKLAITIPLDGQRRQEVRLAVDDSSEQWGDFVSLASLRNRSYIRQFRFTTPDGAVATLLLEPTNRRNNEFKLEYSPNNFGQSGRALLGEYLQVILGRTYLEDIWNAKLTRLDVAFDIRRVPLQDLLITDTKSRKSSIIRGVEGKAESYYFPFTGTNQLCVYDKLKEIDDRLGSPPTNRKRAPWVRFEYRYRRLNRYTLANVVGRMENPFHNFEVKQFGMAQARISVDRLRMLFDACRLQGLDAVLEEIPDIAARATYSLAYRTFPVPIFWQRRTSIWGGLRAAIERSLPT
ncbi:protein of unknown function [Georgfuchsia toluolica]|uniref:Replication initiation factor n=1 Tax=Georgfuchsia toluolica TaxID=424218 RepID=A0A916N9J9_9PROT|nr:replication initiation factor domain-containing protein [Georgfuchsia toluolica]CAG4884065.1 protein of unknown function [Georgfuchsia toluolica]